MCPGASLVGPCPSQPPITASIRNRVLSTTAQPTACSQRSTPGSIPNRPISTVTQRLDPSHCHWRNCGYCTRTTQSDSTWCSPIRFLRNSKTLLTRQGVRTNRLSLMSPSLHRIPPSLPRLAVGPTQRRRTRLHQTRWSLYTHNCVHSYHRRPTAGGRSGSGRSGTTSAISQHMQSPTATQHTNEPP